MLLKSVAFFGPILGLLILGFAIVSWRVATEPRPIGGMLWFRAARATRAVLWTAVCLGAILAVQNVLGIQAALGY